MTRAILTFKDANTGRLWSTAVEFESLYSATADGEGVEYLAAAEAEGPKFNLRLAQLSIVAQGQSVEQALVGHDGAGPSSPETGTGIDGNCA
jgi:hypothetical protein